MKEAATLLVSLGVKTTSQFQELKEKNLRPDNIPANPDKFYPEYEGWRKFIKLGIPDNKVVTYEKLKKHNAISGITNKYAYKQAYKNQTLPEHSPANPEHYFQDVWTSWEDFLAPKHRYITFYEARAFSRKLGLKSTYDWRQYCRSGSKPPYIPSLPDRDYPEFISWQDFLINDD